MENKNYIEWCSPLDNKEITDNELINDMCKLAKMIYEISMKHGDVDITVYKSDGFRHSNCSIKINDKYEFVQYWGNTNEFTKNYKQMIG